MSWYCRECGVKEDDDGWCHCQLEERFWAWMAEQHPEILAEFREAIGLD